MNYQATVEFAGADRGDFRKHLPIEVEIIADIGLKEKVQAALKLEGSDIDDEAMRAIDGDPGALKDNRPTSSIQYPATKGDAQVFTVKSTFAHKGAVEDFFRKLNGAGIKVDRELEAKQNAEQVDRTVKTLFEIGHDKALGRAT